MPDATQLRNECHLRDWQLSRKLANRIVPVKRYADILPAVCQNVEPAQTGFVPGRVDFLRYGGSPTPTHHYRENQSH